MTVTVILGYLGTNAIKRAEKIKTAQMYLPCMYCELAGMELGCQRYI